MEYLPTELLLNIVKLLESDKDLIHFGCTSSHHFDIVVEEFRLRGRNFSEFDFWTYFIKERPELYEFLVSEPLLEFSIHTSSTAADFTLPNFKDVIHVLIQCRYIFGEMDRVIEKITFKNKEEAKTTNEHVIFKYLNNNFHFLNVNLLYINCFDNRQTIIFFCRENIDGLYNLIEENVEFSIFLNSLIFENKILIKSGIQADSIKIVKQGQQCSFRFLVKKLPKKGIKFPILERIISYEFILAKEVFEYNRLRRTLKKRKRKEKYAEIEHVDVIKRCLATHFFGVDLMEKD